MTRIKTIFFAPALMLALAVGLVGCNEPSPSETSATAAGAITFTYDAISLAQSIKAIDAQLPRVNAMAEAPQGDYSAEEWNSLTLNLAVINDVRDGARNLAKSGTVGAVVNAVKVASNIDDLLAALDSSYAIVSAHRAEIDQPRINQLEAFWASSERLRVSLLKLRELGERADVTPYLQSALGLAGIAGSIIDLGLVR